MTIDKNKIRKEVHLTKEILDKLEEQAIKENRSLKNLMESLLINYANSLKK